MYMFEISMHVKNTRMPEIYMQLFSEMYACQKYIICLSKIYSCIFRNMGIPEIYYMHGKNICMYFQNAKSKIGNRGNTMGKHEKYPEKP